MKCPEIQLLDIDIGQLGHLLEKVFDSSELHRHAQDITGKLLECHATLLNTNQVDMDIVGDQIHEVS